MDSNFSPAWFLPGAHFQTVRGRMTRRRRLVPLRREAIETADGDELLLDHLEPHLQETEQRPLHFILLHGLEGSSSPVSIQGILSVIARYRHAAASH